MTPHAACSTRLVGMHLTRMSCRLVTDSSTTISLHWLKRWATASAPVPGWWLCLVTGWIKPAAPTAPALRYYSASQPPQALMKTAPPGPGGVGPLHPVSPLGRSCLAAPPDTASTAPAPITAALPGVHVAVRPRFADRRVVVVGA